MMRFSTIFFCLILVAAAVGRFRAEAGVREDRAEIERIEQKIQEEKQRISQLQLEVEVLESPTRLAQLASTHTSLRPIQPTQVLTAEKFALLMGEDSAMLDKKMDEKFIVNAIAMADFGTVQ